MLLYSNRGLLREMLERKGSVIYSPSVLALGVMQAVICVGVQLLIDQGSRYAPSIPNSYGLNAMGVVVAFSTVFRIQLSWQRYWEALGQVHIMYEKWSDSFTQYSVFVRTTIEKASRDCSRESQAKVKRLHDVYTNVHKHYSLLSALAADRLAHGDVERMNRRAKGGKFKWKDQVVTRKDLRTADLKSPPIELPTFIRGAMKSVSLKDDLQDQGDGLGESDGWKHSYYVEEPPSEKEAAALTDCHDRCNMVMTWVLSGLAYSAGDITVPPPIQSRMYQELSAGMVALLNNVKIADVPFPFPYAQMLTQLVLLFSCFIPVYVACFTQSLIAGPIISFMIFESFWCVNEVAKDLENPFGQDINDIPLMDFHRGFCLRMQETHRALEVVHGGKVDDLSVAQDDVAVDIFGAGVDAAGLAGGSSPSCKAVTPDALTPVSEAKAIITTAREAAHQEKSLPAPPAATTAGVFAASSAAGASSPADTKGSVVMSSKIGQREIGGGTGVEVIDRQLTQIGRQMEQHLAQIVRELDALTAKVGASAGFVDPLAGRTAPLGGSGALPVDSLCPFSPCSGRSGDRAGADMQQRRMPTSPSPEVLE